MTDQLKQRPGDQPLPTPNGYQDIQSAVIAEIEARRLVGIQRYGVGLQPFNGRDTLRDAFEEALDLTTYLRSVIAERDDVDGVAAIQARLRVRDQQLERLTDLLLEFARHLDGLAKWESASAGELRAQLRPIGENLRGFLQRLTREDDRG